MTMTTKAKTLSAITGMRTASLRAALLPLALTLGSVTLLGQMGAPGGGAPPSAGQTNQPMNANNQNAASQMDPSQGSASQMQDRAFVDDLVKGDMAEVQLGQLAAQKGSSADVKQFAQKMVDDHTKLAQQMQPIETAMQMKPPKKMDKKDEKEFAKLTALSGDAFDKEYLACVMKNHEKDLKELKQEATSTANPQLQQIAAKLEQIIQGHLTMATQLAEARGVPMDGKGQRSGL